MSKPATKSNPAFLSKSQKSLDLKMILVQVFALFSIVSTFKLSHHTAFHSDQTQIHGNEIPMKSAIVRDFFKLCTDMNAETDCLQIVFIDDYFWAR